MYIFLSYCIFLSLYLAYSIKVRKRKPGILSYPGTVILESIFYLAKPPVPIISDVASVHDLSEQIPKIEFSYKFLFKTKHLFYVPQIFPRNPVVGLQVVVEDVHADHQVAGVERVRFVPTLNEINYLLQWC